MDANDEVQPDETLDSVQPDRRQFVKGLVATTAFAVPFIASYDLAGIGSASAQVSNNVR